MKQLATFVTALAMALAIGGCKKDNKKGGEGTGEGPTAGKTTTPPPEPPPEKKEFTSADAAEAYKACMDAFNAHDVAKYQACFADDGVFELLDFVGPAKMSATGPAAIGEMVKMYTSAFPDVKQQPQLIMASGKDLAVIALESGTNKGELMGQPATNKQTSVLLAQVVEFNDDGKITKLSGLGDQATYGHQLGMQKSKMAPDASKAWDEPVTVIAEDADKDKIATNIELIKNGLGSVDKLDASGVLPHIADNVEFHYVPNKDVMSGMDAYKKGFAQYLGMSAGMHHDIKEQFGAGDWVFSWSVVDNELKADMPGMKGTKGKKTKLNQIEFLHLTDNKIDQQWVFENSLQFALQVGLIEPPAGGGDAAAAGDAKKGAGAK